MQNNNIDTCGNDSTKLVITYINEDDYTFSCISKIYMGIISLIYAFIIVGGLLVYSKLDHNNDDSMPIFIIIYVITGLIEMYCMYMTRYKFLNYEKITLNMRNLFILQTSLNHITLFTTSILSYFHPNLLSPHNVSNIFICIGAVEVVCVPFMILFVCAGCCCVGYESLISWCLKGIDRGYFSDTDSDSDEECTSNPVQLQSMYHDTKQTELIV